MPAVRSMDRRTSGVVSLIHIAWSAYSIPNSIYMFVSHCQWTHATFRLAWLSSNSNHQSGFEVSHTVLIHMNRLIYRHFAVLRLSLSHLNAIHVANRKGHSEAGKRRCSLLSTTTACEFKRQSGVISPWIVLKAAG
jgi:hypothetical protein